MKVKLFNKVIGEFNNVFFSSDLHLGHQNILTFGRKFDNIQEMDTYITAIINSTVSSNDLIVLLGDTMMGQKDYSSFLNSIICDNVILLVGNHCNRSKLLTTLHETDKLLYLLEYAEFVIEGQIICCSHYPMMHWNYQSDNSISLHGHLHGDEPSQIIKDIHEHNSMDVGIDAYYNEYSIYGLYDLNKIIKKLKNKVTISRH